MWYTFFKIEGVLFMVAIIAFMYFNYYNNKLEVAKLQQHKINTDYVIVFTIFPYLIPFAIISHCIRKMIDKKVDNMVIENSLNDDFIKEKYEIEQENRENLIIQIKDLANTIGNYIQILHPLNITLLINNESVVIRSIKLVDGFLIQSSNFKNFRLEDLNIENLKSLQSVLSSAYKQIQ